MVVTVMASSNYQIGLNQPTIREKEAFKGGERSSPFYRDNRTKGRKKGWQGAESETEQLKLQECLQRKRDRLNAESAEERAARLQQMHNRLAAESAEQGEVKLLQFSTIQRERLSQLNRKRPGYCNSAVTSLNDWLLSQLISVGMKLIGASLSEPTLTVHLCANCIYIIILLWYVRHPCAAIYYYIVHSARYIYSNTCLEAA